MAAAQGDAALVGHGNDIVGMHVIEQEADQSGSADARSEEADALEAREQGESVGAELLVMLGNARPADAVQVVHGGAQSDGAGDVGRAGLEFVGGVFPGALVELDVEDYLTAALVGRQGLEGMAWRP